jgi:hypothetical protein
MGSRTNPTNIVSDSDPEKFHALVPLEKKNSISYVLVGHVGLLRFGSIRIRIKSKTNQELEKTRKTSSVVSHPVLVPDPCKRAFKLKNNRYRYYFTLCTAGADTKQCRAIKPKLYY